MLASFPMNNFFPTKNAEKARRFYEGVLGLTFVSENPFVATFRSGQTTIVAQKMKQFEPVPYTILGWEVKNIEQTVSFLTKSGVVFERFSGMEQDDLGIWKSPEGKVAWFKDPDGNTLSVSEH